MWSPDEHARAAGILVLEAVIPESGRAYPRRRLVVLRAGLDTITRRCVLAHELAHIFAGDDCSTPRAERRAWRWAAQRLVTLDDLVTCALEHPEHPEIWCDTLRVTPHVLRTWLSNPSNYSHAERLIAAAA